jgi:PAB-dependent poly(A)-specific ribonuclease subunit 2
MRQGGDSNEEIPARYRLKLRPSFKTAGAFDPAEYNNSGLFPGWDYAPTMPNAFASPVLLLLYFVPEILSATLSAQYDDKLFSPKAYEKALSPELGFVFHQIQSLCCSGLIQQIKSKIDPLKPRIGAWHASNFLTTLASMPEAEQLQILDGSPAAVDHPRRPEAFYRFLAYQLDRELSKNSGKKVVDSLQGLDFISINQFIAGTSPASHSETRVLTVDLFYDTFGADTGTKGVRFGELLQRSLCRETRLRAWNHTSKAYETIVQRKIATSLPKILGLSCACAGRKDEDGLCVWRADDGKFPWLPEFVEIELEADGNVVVREMQGCGDEASWIDFKGESSLPPAISKLVSETSSPTKHRYRLDAVLSYVVDDAAEAAVDDDHPGHHVLHARVPREYKARAIKMQQQEADMRASLELDSTKLVMTADLDPDIFRKRSARAGEILSQQSDDDSEWVLYNGFLVSKTVVEDARAFHVTFKEPCLVIFRSLDEESGESGNKTHSFVSPRIPVQVMNARSLGANGSKTSTEFKLDVMSEGKLVAFDAEFVSVQEEEASINESGAKVVIRETRHAVGRISVIDCDSRKVILDDHVLPKERVVDYLTRFSGIVAEDLDPVKSPHNLISSRSAYLKLRYLMEQGCIFVGHGLRQDFLTLNLIVPPHQILGKLQQCQVVCLERVVCLTQNFPRYCRNIPPTWHEVYVSPFLIKLCARERYAAGHP